MKALLLLLIPIVANAYGRITRIAKGVWELDLGALGVLTQDHEGDASVTNGGASQSFSRIAGGFAVAGGYAF